MPGRSQFAEYHHGVVDAPVAAVWRALHEVTWRDLRLTKPLLLVRGFGIAGMDKGCLRTFHEGGAAHDEAGHTHTFAMIGKPWSPVPQSRPAGSLDEVRDFHEPGWLKYGMDWQLTQIGPARTLIETTTLCEATDARARASFSAYWLLIRAGSGLIRRDLIATLGRLATRPGTIRA